MEPLLTDVLEAHGGAAAWEEVSSLVVRASLGGPFWEGRGWPGVYDDQTITLDTERERITFAPFTGPDCESLLEVDPERVTVRGVDGTVVEERENPRDSAPLPFSPTDTKWDAIQVAYFTSAACWSYFTTPFLLARPDVEITEIEPWQEEGETWRRLAATFGASIATHNAHQTFYFGEDLLLRRLDYSPDVTGNPPIAHYTYDHRTFGGFVFPTRRRVLLHDAEGHANKDFATITIDVQDIEVKRA